MWSDNEIIVQWGLALGRFPDRWRDAWRSGGQYFNEVGDLLAEQENLREPDSAIEERVVNLTHRIRNKPAEWVGDEQMAEYKHLMLAVFKLEPAERITAEETADLLPKVWAIGREVYQEFGVKLPSTKEFFSGPLDSGNVPRRVGEVVSTFSSAVHTICATGS